MARCPYGPHRLRLQDNLTCQRCGQDFRLYAAFLDLPIALYNEARRLWDVSNLVEASTCLHAAIQLHAEFPEAHWLLAAVHVQEGRLEAATAHLNKALEFGAEIDPIWVETLKGEAGEP